MSGATIYAYVGGNPVNAIDPLGLLESFRFDLNGQSTSSLQGQNGVSFPAFSGLNDAINQPSRTGDAGVGPLPTGNYYIVDRPTGGLIGPLLDRLRGKNEWFALFRDDGTIDDQTTTGDVTRGQFRLHPKGPLGISKGCVTINSKDDYKKLREMLLSTKKGIIPGTNIPYYGTIQVTAGGEKVRTLVIAIFLVCLQ